MSLPFFGIGWVPTPGRQSREPSREIEKADSRGAHVAILRCTRAVSPADVDADQAGRLEEYLDKIRHKALILEYDNDDRLRQHVEAILTRIVSAASAHAEAQVEVDQASLSSSATENPAQVWARVERREGAKTDSQGRVKTESRWFLVLSNTGREAAMHVTYVLEPDGEGEVPMDMGSDRELESLPPGVESENQLYLHSGVADQARCTVTWEDSVGEHESLATLRFF